MKKIISILYRYFLILTLINIYLSNIFSNFIRIIFTYISYFFLKIFFKINLISGNIFWKNHLFIISKECIGISAYILLTFLFLSIPIKKKILFNGLSLSLITFTIINLIRIIFLMLIFILFGKNLFNNIHLIFYEALTGIIVGLIFLYFYKKYKIKEKPLLTDYKTIIKKYFE